MNLWQQLKNRKINIDLVDKLLNQTEHEVKQMTPINIIVAGKTGSGKSTLINALFREKLATTGVGQPITQSIEKITKDGMPLTLYDTKGLELSAEVQEEVLRSLSDLIRSQAEKGEREAIDVIYYCINANMGRIESFEIELIQALAEILPVIVVLTQAIGQEHRDFVKYLQGQELGAKRIIPVLAKPYLIQGEQYIPVHGLDTLIETTLDLVPGEVHKAFINAQQIDLDRKVVSARSWAQKYITTAFGVGFSPMPVADATVLVPMQITMLAHITAIFGLSLDKAQIMSLIAGVGGTGGMTMLGKVIVGSAFKLIPGIGSVAGSVISGTTASSLTLALAYGYIEVLKRIAQAEASGRDVPLKEIQEWMQTNFKEQLSVVGDAIPDQIKDTVLPHWFKGFFNGKDK